MLNHQLSAYRRQNVKTYAAVRAVSLLVGLLICHAVALVSAPLPALLQDINSGSGNSTPQSFVEFAGKVYFTAISGSQRHLYAYDPSLPSGSQVVKVSNFTLTGSGATTYPNYLTPLNGKLLMVANGSANGPELWEFDPAAAPGAQFTEIAFDGTVTTNAAPSRLYVHEEKLYFTASNGARPAGQGTQLYVYDPALPKRPLTDPSANPKRITDLNPSWPGGSTPANLVGLPGKLLFSAMLGMSDNQTCCGAGVYNADNQELVMVDTATHAVSVFDLAPGSATLRMNGADYIDWYDSSPLSSRVVIGSTLYFSANYVEAGSWRGNVLMKFQPSTMASPVKVAELNSDSGVTVTPDGIGFMTTASYASGDAISSMVALGTKVFFGGRDVVHGQELFVCDTANADAVTLVADVAAGAAGSSPGSLAAWNGNLYFAADAGSGHGMEAWEFNPGLNSLVEIADIAPGSAGSFPAGFLPYNGKLHFRAQSASQGGELFVFDPVSRAVSMLLDLSPGSSAGASSFNSASPSAASFPNALTFGRNLLFAGNNGVSGTELFDFPLPVANPDTYVAPHGSPLSVAAPGPLTNDTPAAGLGLMPVLVTSTSHGELSLGTDGRFTYVPEGGFIGNDAFTYYVSDGVTSSAPTTVSITVAPPIPQLYYITQTNGNAQSGDGLRKIGVDGSWPSMVLDANTITNATALTIDRKRNRALIADSLPSGSQKIVSVSLADGAVTPFLNTPSLTVNDMKIDEANDMLYFITATNGNAVPGDGLRRVKLDGTGETIIMDGNMITNALSLALDLANNRAFIYESFSGLQKIYAVNLTSGSVSPFLDLRNITTVKLQVDAKNSHLYFSVATNGNAVIGDGLRRINLDGTGLTSIIEGNQITNANAMALDLENDRAFIACSFAGRQRIYKVGVSSGTVTPFLETPNITIPGMVIPTAPVILAPSISSISVLGAGTYTAGQSLQFAVDFNAPVAVEALDGFPVLNLKIGTQTRPAIYSGTSEAGTLQFLYTVQEGDEDVDGISLESPIQLNGGSIRGTNGLDALLSFTAPDLSAVRVDAVTPYVVSVKRKSPAQESLGANSATFTVTFSENVQGVSAASFVVTPVGNSTVTGSVSSIVGNANVYDVTVNLSGGRGEFRLDVVQPELP